MQDRMTALREMLQKSPLDSGEIAAKLGVSQPTVSRLLDTMKGEVVPLGAARARKYALAREIPGVETPIPLTRVTETGEVEPVGMLNVLQGEWFALTPPPGAKSNHYELYLGLPFFLADLRPQGFLGRLEPLRHQDLQLPRDILRWSDGHTLKYLSRRSEHAPGNLILGNESLERFLKSRLTWRNELIAAADRSSQYPALAMAAMQGDPPGSSAGGEQPKFTALVDRGAGSEGIEHVIVKFSPRVDSVSGRRWADLLVCEHMALQVLQEFNIPAAQTSVLELDDRVFLEIVRFDRTGAFGRLPMVTMAGIDGELGMLDRSWTEVADVLKDEHKLSAQDTQLIEILDLYGALIGNVDKHHGNIAVSWGFQEPFRILPAYDMLPMLYRPNTHGEVVPREWNTNSLKNMQLMQLGLCYQMARTFWERAIADARISDEFKEIAIRHAQAIQVMDPGVTESDEPMLSPRPG